MNQLWFVVFYLEIVCDVGFHRSHVLPLVGVLLCTIYIVVLLLSVVSYTY